MRRRAGGTSPVIPGVVPSYSKQMLGKLGFLRLAAVKRH
jgi:hypothetical protein